MITTVIFRILGRLNYLIYRHVYTTSHLLAFMVLGSRWDKYRSSADRSRIILCGVEYQNPESIARINDFREWALINFPGKQVVLFSKLVKCEVPATSGCIRQVPWEWETRARLIHSGMSLFFGKGRLYPQKAIHAIARDAAFMFDIGSYQISSNLDTGWTANALSNIVFARRYDIPFLMGTQRFGPFRYRPQTLNCIYRAMIKNIIPYVAYLGAIDDASFLYISEFSDNAVLCPNYEDFFLKSRQLLK